MLALWRYASPTIEGSVMNTKSNNAIELLTEDHRQVSGLFNQYADLTDGDQVGKKRLGDQICSALLLHSTVEEEIFYPAMRNAGVVGEEVLDEAAAAHGTAEKLIAQLRGMDAGDASYDGKIVALSEVILQHVDKEESEIFPKARNKKLDLPVLGRIIATRKQELVAQA
jgi:hemerythrin superfamily protein